MGCSETVSKKAAICHCYLDNQNNFDTFHVLKVSLWLHFCDVVHLAVCDQPGEGGSEKTS